MILTAISESFQAAYLLLYILFSTQFGLKVEYTNDPTIDLEKNVRFFLYTVENSNVPQQLFVENVTSIENSYFRKFKPTKFVIHGYGRSYTQPEVRQTIDAFLQNNNFNVIAVDWSKLANEFYSKASASVKLVGGHVARMIDFLKEKFEVDEKSIEIFGQSLGCQVAGLAGLQVKTGKVASVFALDPAGLLFEHLPEDQRLSKLSGDLVQVLHSTGGKIVLKDAIGHLDFFSNGGSEQPGCEFEWRLDFLKSIVKQFECNHLRSHYLFLESISKKSVVGRECESYEEFLDGKCNSNHVELLYGGSNKKPGKYYFRTAVKSPYGLGEEGATSTVYMRENV